MGRRPHKPPRAALQVAVVVAALLGILLIFADLLHRHLPPAQRFAQAISAGEAQARADLTYEAQDGDLLDDEAAAGAMWAKSHDADNPGECPPYSATFRKGCADFIGGR